MDNIRDFISEENVIKDEIYKAFCNSVTCPICSDILIEPMMCMNCQTVDCRKCKEDWLLKSNTCPNRCPNPNYQKCLDISELLSQLKFICPNCDDIINYDDIQKHSLINCTRKGKMEKLKQSFITSENSVNSKKNIFYIHS